MRYIAAVVLLSSGLALGAEQGPQASRTHRVGEIEARLPAYEAVAAILIQAPAHSIQMGLSEEIYRCWELRMTGDHGRMTLRLFERLLWLHQMIQDRTAKLRGELAEYKASQTSDPDVEARLWEHGFWLDSLIAAYDQSVRLGEREGLLRVRDASFLSLRRTVSPRLYQGDYTMVYDEAAPSCRARTSEG